MALPGLELLHSCISSQLTSLDDAAIAVIHWNLISNGLKCYGRGESWPQSPPTSQGSELLPSGWNADTTVYSLRYVDPTTDRKYLLKVVAMDDSLIIHLIRCFDEKTVSTSIRSRDFVNDQYSTFHNAFTNLDEFNSQLTKELYKGLVEDKSNSSSKVSASNLTSSSSNPQGQTGRSPLVDDRHRGGIPPGGIGGPLPFRSPFGASSVDPFGVGRADLDPFSGGVGGGMFMDPRNFPGQGRGIGPGGPLGPGQPGFPPGSIPPGARFDPVGPPGLRPNPDPDHQRPPDYDDMFM